MAGHPLDNPAWGALAGPHAGFGLVHGRVRRYHPDVAPFAALEAITPEGLADLAASAPDAGVTGLVTPPEPIDIPDPLEQVLVADVLQMLADPPRPPETAGPALAELGEADVPAMVALVELTQPGPFARRTREMGRYLGIFADGRLAAMAGERMRLPGFTEVSAVCTHPDFRGRGYAKALVAAIAAGIVARGEVPFLHVYPENRPAIATYEALGFTPRRLLRFTVVRRKPPAA